MTTLANAAGTGPNSTGKQLTAYADFASKAETLTIAPPGLLTRAEPTLLGGIPNTGFGMTDAAALLLKMGTVKPNLQRDATSIVQLAQSTQQKPTADALKRPRSDSPSGRVARHCTAGRLAGYRRSRRHQAVIRT